MRGLLQGRVALYIFRNNLCTLRCRSYLSCELTFRSPLRCEATQIRNWLMTHCPGWWPLIMLVTRGISMRRPRPQHPLSPGPGIIFHPYCHCSQSPGLHFCCFCPNIQCIMSKVSKVHFLISTVFIQVSTGGSQRWIAGLWRDEQIHCSKMHRNNSWEIFGKLLNKAQIYYFTKKVWKINISSHCYRLRWPRITGMGWVDFMEDTEGDWDHVPLNSIRRPLSYSPRAGQES